MFADAVTAAATAPSTIGRVHEPHAAVSVVAFEHVADGEDGAAQIAEYHDACALVGSLDGCTNAVLVGSETAIRKSAGRLDAHVGSGHLRGESGKAFRKVRAVRYDYDPDHGTNLHYRSGFDNTES